MNLSCVRARPDRRGTGDIFKDGLSTADVDRGLGVVATRAIVVGHHLQGKVSAQFGGRVFAIDVRHPKDCLTSFPLRRSEGLLIKEEQYFRLLQDGGAQPLRP